SCPTNEQEPMYIALGILPIPCGTPARHWQHAYLLVIANGFRWHASGMGELADRQQVSHGPSSFLFLRLQRYTFHSLEGQEEFFRHGLLTCRTNFREIMRIELSSWDEHKNYCHPRASR